MHNRSFIRWPERILGPRPGLKEINVVCWGIFILFLLAPICILLAVQFKVHNLYFEKSPVDFVYFYGTGKIADTHPAIAVYDYGLQLETFNKVVRLDNGMYGPSPYPPFVSQFFRLFAKLSFVPAFLVWTAISLVLYVAGVTMVLREFFPTERLERSLILCFALASAPFLMNTLGNGQLSSVGLFFISLAIVEERRSRPFLSGLALSVLIYKPTLLLFAIPMLIVTRRFKTLGGFATGASVLGLISTLVAGIRIWPAYLHFLNSFGKTSGVYGQSSLRLWKYVDLNSLSYALPGGRSRVALLLLACGAIAVAGWVAVVWWRSAAGGRTQRTLAWPVAMTWTMLVNVYYPIYDSILIVIAIIIALSTLRELASRRAFEWMITLAVLTFAVAWFTEPVAKQFGVQLLTLAILVVAITQTVVLQRLTRQQAFEAVAVSPAL